MGVELDPVNDSCHWYVLSNQFATGTEVEAERGSTGEGRRTGSTTRTDIANGKGGTGIATEKGYLGKIFEVEHFKLVHSILSCIMVQKLLRIPISRETRSSSDARVKEEPRREDRGGEPRREERSDSHRERR